MSSSSDRPYKSRFFNFLNRYSIRIKDQAGVAWRNAAQTSVEWGLQILLYPVYLVVQAGRFAQRQLKQSVRKVPRLIASRLKKQQPAELLSPTERVLESIHLTVPEDETSIADFLSRFKIYSQDPFLDLQNPSALTVFETPVSTLVPETFKIQGIVSLLEDHRLALVTNGNLILDVFTDEQQKTLEDRICLEIANYWYEVRLRFNAQRNTPGLMPSFRKTWPNVLPPVRWFWRIMRWEQTSDIAKEINLFGESSLVPLEPSSSELLPPLLTRLDEKLAVIEEQDLISLTQWVQRTLTQTSTDLSNSPTWKIQVLIRAAVAYFFGSTLQELSTSDGKSFIIPGAEKGQKLLEAAKEKGSDWLYTVGDRINDHIPESTDPESDPFKIQVLIKSALSYYLAKEETTPQALPTQSEPPVQDPWLTWNDIFTPTTDIKQSSVLENCSTWEPPLCGGSPRCGEWRGDPKTAFSALEPQLVTALPPAPQALPQPTQQPQIKRPSPIPPRKVAPKPQSIAPVAPLTASVEQKKPEIVHQPFPTSYDSHPDQNWPDWVEIKSTPTGYEKHFLERILDGFDKVMFWIEELFIKLWQWFQGKKQNRKRNQR
ncbi:hypothetical protein [Chroococcus sp. FPU101]|uniref:hypothetical protein n=1 Tax=Chroococcus sp. FPU101 TaxID=1974212 RepID=UPI001A8C5A5C|nr:hypothetical protein [Chroococcus sp. FPU101]GFE70872.1 hypothetical protein CFPU101_34820 [Chroococcus sp. FPU101]